MGAAGIAAWMRLSKSTASAANRSWSGPRWVAAAGLRAYTPAAHLIPVVGLTVSKRDFSVEDYEPTPASGQPRKKRDKEPAAAAGEGAPAAEYGMALDDFVNHDSSMTATLLKPEVLALRLYTTIAFKSLNNPLRDRDPQRPPHPFPITINFIKSAIGKLRAVEASSGDKGKIDLWRGMKNLKLTDNFRTNGGTELACMSTSTNKEVVAEYAKSDQPLIFRVVSTSFLNRGADIKWLSLYAHEDEILYPPCTYLRPTGRTALIELADALAAAARDVQAGTLAPGALAEKDDPNA